MTKIITMYNNKGGVSKTTTLFNLGVYLSLQGKRILFADCDPQCNLTELFFSSNFDTEDPDVKTLPGTSIYEALLPRFRGEASRIDQSKIEIVTSSLYSNLFLFRGDLEFSQAEIYLGTAWDQAITEDIHQKNTYVALYNLLHDLGKAKGYDYILCDVGPSTGSITRTVVLSCDGIFLPVVPDRFCNQAVRLLGLIVGKWIEKHRQIMKTLLPYKIEGFPGSPLLLGAVVQNFKIHSASRTKQSYVRWQESISDAIKSDLIGADKFPTAESFDPSSPYVATIRDVGPLAPVSQMFGRAIFDIQQEHTKEASTTGQMYYGTVWDPWKDRMNEYKAEIAKIASKIP